MAYDDNFETIELPEEDMSQAQKIIVAGLLRQGEFSFREELIEMLETDLQNYIEELDYEPNQDWIDGYRYVIHLVKEMKSDNDRRRQP